MAERNPQDSLSRTLQSWRVAPRRNPNFRTETWARIDSQRGASDVGWLVYLRRHVAGWALALAVTATAAGFGGHWAGAARNERDRDAILAMYVTAIDARAMSANGR